VCDLKHYKSGNVRSGRLYSAPLRILTPVLCWQFALRWRTETEVLAGEGETTCGNTRCGHHHHIPERLAHTVPPLTTLELPFAYVEHGENKAALVKVVLCPKCLDKLMWKRRKDKERAQDDSRVELDYVKREDLGIVREDKKKERRMRGRSKDVREEEGGVKQEEVEVDLGSQTKERRRKDRSVGGGEKRHRRRSSRSRSPHERKQLRFS
jgi:protein FRA10AC1